MSRIKELVDGIVKNNDQQFWDELFLLLKNKDFTQTQLAPVQDLLRTSILKANDMLFVRFGELVNAVYARKKELLLVMYKLLPVLMQKYIQINFVKLQGLEECLIAIYNQEYRSFNEAQAQRNELSRDVAIRTLYQNHLGKQISTFEVENLELIQQINHDSRNDMKTLMFYLIYKQAHNFGPQALSDYYKALFIYCGADEKDLATTGSLYLLEKINKISIFRYSITQEELEWIILTLYELCIQVKKDKFDLLAVVNAIHKKVSNESLFRISDLANSLIQLLEDEYSEVFV